MFHFSRLTPHLNHCSASPVCFHCTRTAMAVSESFGWRIGMKPLSPGFICTRVIMLSMWLLAASYVFSAVARPCGGMWQGEQLV